MRVYVTICLLIIFGFSLAQPSETIGLLKYSEQVSEGFSLLTPLFSKKAYLVDNCGDKIHQWQLNRRPGPTYLMPNGDLLTSGWDSETMFKAGGVGGYLERLDWNSNVLWSIKISDEFEALHHDFHVLQNGNILIIVWERISSSEVLSAGRSPNKYAEEIFSEKVMEIRPIGSNDYEVVWEWRVWDHLVQDYSDLLNNFGNPKLELGKIDVNYDSDLANGRDWIHFNSLDYDEENDLILLSARHFNEIWVVDHSTSSEEVKGSQGGNFNRGGELIYRWGNPRVYDVELDNQILFGQHDARWLKQDNELNIMVFNNGFNKTPNKSTVEIINTGFHPESGFLIDSEGVYLPIDSEIIYNSDDPDFYSSITSGAQLLEPSNLLVSLGSSGHCFEIDLTTNEIIWEYVNPVTGMGPQNQGSSVVSPDPTLSNTIFKLWRYDYSYLTNNLALSFIEQPQPIELNDAIDLCLITSTEANTEKKGIRLIYSADYQSIEITGATGLFEPKEFLIYDMQGRKLLADSYDRTIDISSLNQGNYILSVSNLIMSKRTFRFLKQ